MPKKIRFPLEMADGAQVRDLEELREHFDLETVVSYYKNSKLTTWLGDRYLDAEKAAVEALDENAPDFQQRLCAVFGAEYTGEAVDLEEVERRQERLARLRAFTDEPEFIDHIDEVAFDQEDLADLLDEGAGTIYLCGKSFSIPLSVKDKRYIGINDPEIRITSSIVIDFTTYGIAFNGIHFCKEYQGLINEQLHSKENVAVEKDSPEYNTVQISEEITEIQKIMAGWDYYTCFPINVDFDISILDMSNIAEDHCSKSKCKERAQELVRKVYNNGMAYLSVGTPQSASKKILTSVKGHIESDFERIIHHLRVLEDFDQKLQSKLAMVKQHLNLSVFVNDLQCELDSELNENYYSLYKLDYFFDRIEYTDSDCEMETGILRLFEKAYVSYYFNASDPYEEILKDTQDYVDTFAKNASRIVCELLCKRRDRINDIFIEMQKAHFYVSKN